MFSYSPEQTFELGRRIGSSLVGGEMLLLSGGLGAGKTLLTKGIVEALGFDVDEVNSPSFALVNLYKTETCDVYHIDLWRLGDAADPAAEIGLHEILEDPRSIVIIEWSEHLSENALREPLIRIKISGDGDDPRRIEIGGSDNLELEVLSGC